jgi:2-methylisocitrate lyase-like PEP mutase family enzyme
MDARSILLDPRFLVPRVPPASRGVAWLRANVVRFSESGDHRRRRALVEGLLADIEPAGLERAGDHVATLADALGLPRSVVRDVRTVAESYQPHTTATAAADAAVARLVDACGGSWDERTANVIGILVQACDATAALVAGRMPPVPATARITPDGSTVRVELDAVPFGAGRHACPGRAHAEALAAGARRFHALHHGPEPLVLPNAWDAASAALFVEAGFAAVGTTSLGLAAATGVPDGSGRARDATVRLLEVLVRLPVPVTVDIEAGWGADLRRLAADLAEAGVAGVNIEDGRGTELAPPSQQAAAITALKEGAPNLFVNARVDTHWLGTDQATTIDRARCYVDAGADGIFVPGLADDGAIASIASTVDAPLNVLAGGDVARLRDLGVRRISTGSLPYRAGLSAALQAVTAVRDGHHGAAASTVLSYSRVDALARLVT